MRENISRSAKREYWVSENDGLWRAMYRPLNPKTGQPWQAARDVGVEGWDAYRGYGRNGMKGLLMIGTPPPFEVWHGVMGYTSLYRGFSLKEFALIAIENAKQQE